MIEKLGSDQAVTEYMKQVGSKGGSVSGIKKGFAISGKSGEAGSKGGRRSRKGFRFIKESRGRYHYIENATGKKVTMPIK